MKDLSKRLAGLSPSKLALLSKLLREEGGAAAPAAPAARREEGADCPLSFAQERLWSISQIEEDSAAYNIPLLLRLRGRLDLAAMERTLREVVRRHEVLRTTFKLSDDRPRQVIEPEARLALPLVDLRGLPAEARETEAARLAQEESQRPFDLAAGPALRLLVLRLGEDDHGVILVMHHILTDEWSMTVLTREVAAIYEAFSLGLPSPLPEPPLQYADFAVRQRERLTPEVLEGHLAYWRHQLGPGPPVLSLPTDYARPERMNFEGATQVFRLGRELSASVRELTRREDVTLFMALLAAFATLMHYHSRQEDIVVGTDVANRDSVETEGLIGFFSNQLVLRLDLSGDPGFRELLGRVRRTTLDAYAHREMPFERLVRALQTRRDPSRLPLFQVKLVLQNDPPVPLELPGLTLEPMPFENRTAKFDLLMTIVNQGEELTGSLEYRTDLWNGGSVARMLHRFESLLREAVARPDARLGELAEALREADRRQLMESREALKATRLKRTRATGPQPASR